MKRHRIVNRHQCTHIVTINLSFRTDVSLRSAAIIPLTRRIIIALLMSFFFIESYDYSTSVCQLTRVVQIQSHVDSTSGFTREETLTFVYKITQQCLDPLDKIFALCRLTNILFYASTTVWRIVDSSRN